jgi:hypothetical protein
VSKLTVGATVTVRVAKTTQSTGYVPGEGYTYGFVYPGDQGTVAVTDAAFVRYHSCPLGCKRNDRMLIVDFPAGRVGTCRRSLKLV